MRSGRFLVVLIDLFRHKHKHDYYTPCLICMLCSGFLFCDEINCWRRDHYRELIYLNKPLFK